MQYWTVSDGLLQNSKTQKHFYDRSTNIFLNAPEHLGSTKKPFTPQSDVYNVAAILYLLFTGGDSAAAKERFEFKEPCWKVHLATHKTAQGSSTVADST